jgi:hypothetical protein
MTDEIAGLVPLLFALMVLPAMSIPVVRWAAEDSLGRNGSAGIRTRHTKCPVQSPCSTGFAVSTAHSSGCRSAAARCHGGTLLKSARATIWRWHRDTRLCSSPPRNHDSLLAPDDRHLLVAAGQRHRVTSSE